MDTDKCSIWIQKDLDKIVSLQILRIFYLDFNWKQKVINLSDNEKFCSYHKVRMGSKTAFIYV